MEDPPVESVQGKAVDLSPTESTPDMLHISAPWTETAKGAKCLLVFSSKV